MGYAKLPEQGGGGQQPSQPAPAPTPTPKPPTGGGDSKDLPWVEPETPYVPPDRNQPANDWLDEIEGEQMPPMQWTQIEQLHPMLQRALDAQFGLQAGRAELAQGRLGDLYKNMGQEFDWEAYGAPIDFDPSKYGGGIEYDPAERQRAEDAAYQRSTNRLDPEFQKQAEQLEITLRNKGLRPGDQAYESEMDRFNRTKTDAYEQARLGATAEGRLETELGMDQTKLRDFLRRGEIDYGFRQNELANVLRSQQMQEDLMARGYTLDEINALMQGQEIEGSTPSMSNSTTQSDILSTFGLGGGG